MMVAAIPRATRDGKRISTRPLTDARIRRILAVASSALGGLVPHTLPLSVPRRCQMRAVMITDTRAGTLPVRQSSLLSGGGSGI